MGIRTGNKKLSVALALLAFGMSPLGAQEDPPAAYRLDVFGSIDWVSLYQGDATVGAYSGWGATGSLALRSLAPVGAEIFFVFSPQDSDPYSRSPRFLIPGAWFTISFIGDPMAGADLFLAIGTAYVHTSGWPDSSGCVPPCFAEGGASFQNGAEFSFVWGAGLSYSLSRLLSFRVDLRVPGGTPRVGLGIGARVR